MVVRLQVPRAVPLEIWRLLLASGDALATAIRVRPEHLLEGLELLHRGEGRTRDGRTDHHVCAGYRHLVIGGGRSHEIPDAVLARGPTPFSRLTDVHLAEAGGLALAAEAGFGEVETLVLDLGQTSIKISYAGRRARLARDLEALPRGRVGARDQGGQRQALREFLARALIEATRGLPPPRAVVVGLPGEVSARGIPGASTYAGTADDAALLPDALVLAGLAPELVGVLNDAELAAASAARLPAAAEATLVLTLGFGLGAAFLREAASP